MATAYHHLSDYDAASIPSTEGMRFGIVVADWNDRYTYAMAEAAIDTLRTHGVSESDIIVEFFIERGMYDIDAINSQLYLRGYNTLTNRRNAKSE